MAVTALITDINLQVLGDPVPYTKVAATKVRNAPGSYEMSLPGDDAVHERATGPGNRVVLLRDGAVWCAGPIEYPDEYTWTADPGDASGPGLSTIRWTDDLALVCARNVYPNASLASNAQVVAARTWTATNAETIIRNMVGENASSTAVLTARRVPGLVLGSATGVGSSIDYTSRFSLLDDDLRAVALAGGDLNYRTRQVGNQILFEVSAPADQSSWVRYSRRWGNLRSVQYKPQAPSATVAIVGGDGDGAARTIRERSNTAALAAGWPRMEAPFTNASGTNAELDQAADQTLAEHGETVDLSVEAVDTAEYRFGEVFDLGDLVAVEVWPGRVVSAYVSGATLTADQDGELLTVHIGIPPTVREPALMRELRRQARRVGVLERR